MISIMKAQTCGQPSPTAESDIMSFLSRIPISVRAHKRITEIGMTTPIQLHISISRGNRATASSPPPGEMIAPACGSEATTMKDEPDPECKRACPEMDNNGLSPPSLQFPSAKLEDIMFDSPTTTALLEVLLSDQVADCDFMLCSPVRSCPPLPQVNSTCDYGDSRAMKGKSILGCTPPRFSSQLGSPMSAHKFDRGPSPIHRVFNSPVFQDLLADFNVKYDVDWDGLGTYSSPHCFDLPTTTKQTLEMPNASRLRVSIDKNLALEESHLSHCENNYQPIHTPAVPGAATAATTTFSEQLEEEHHQEQHQYHQLKPLPTSTDQENDGGLQLVHLLLACAEAVSREDQMLGRRYLHNLSQIATPLGDPLQRLVSCFMDALSERLAASLSSNLTRSLPPFPPNSLEILKIYQILYQACPYVKFAHFTANLSIFDAFQNEERVHVIDLDILQGYQWPAFMQALAARPGGAPFLRITGVGPCLESVSETGQCLANFAHSMHIPFEFHPVAERLETLKPHMLNRRVGEALAVNSVNRLHRVPRICLGSLLTMIREQAPIILTLVEQEASHNGAYFMGRFLEALHYYSAIFESLDVTFPPNSMQRVKVEQYIFAPVIRNIVASEGPERTERHERLDQWRKLMEGKGFRGVPLSENAVAQSKILLDSYSCGGYRVTEDNGCLLLGWQDRALVAASAWQC